MRFRDHDATIRVSEDHDPGDEDDPVDFWVWVRDWRAECDAIIARLRALADGGRR